ncbi:hypothetical protein MERGE_001987 [Pneumocystis wakefieldiae]|uniref:Golgi apparatus membrane protein TVP23 n=1 Tax=Pneumocystis wakefieldiae TaxID=38082 RepID=A0A899FWL6_9ASCO|nr:hypothetical protein MERGE_001987 [Pneumocystis wakefieldiae]
MIDRRIHELHLNNNLAVGQNKDSSIFELSSHPIALFFFFLFRFLAILLYLFGFFIFRNFILVFILIVVFSAFDFWTVKNVSGRLLVGLRWRNEIDNDGKNIWVFENMNLQNKQNPTDSKTFWLVLYLAPILWAVFGIIAILRFNFIWLVVVIIAFSLSGTNALAFTKNQMALFFIFLLIVL